MSTRFFRRHRAVSPEMTTPRFVAEPLEGRTLLSVAIASGQTITATIGKVGETDTYTTAGVAGGALMATVAETTAGSTLSPRIEIHAPGGAILTYNYNAVGTTVTALNLAATGTYTLVVSDEAAAHTGGYAVTAVSIGTGITQTAGGDAGAATSGITRSASLPAGDIDAFTLAGKVGGTIMASVGETVAGSSLTPIIELYSPTGARLTYNYNAAGTTITALSLPTTGTYTVTVRDDTGAGTGSYAVTPVSIGTGLTSDAGGDAGSTTSGTTRSVAIGVGDIDVFTLAGVAGGSLMATVSETTIGSALTPIIELYGPAGQRLTYNYNASGTTITSLTLPTTGTYTLTVRNDIGTGTGAYAMTPVSIGTGLTQTSGTDAGATTSGITTTASLPVGDIDAFTLPGVAGGSLMATVGETVAGSSLTPIIELYSPTGARLTYNYNAAGTTITALNLPSTGTYTLTVRDDTGTGTGGYAVTPISLGAGVAQNSGGDAGATGSGVTRSAAITVGDIDAFTVADVAGGSLEAVVGETVTGSPLTPLIELYSPAGTRLTLNYNAAGTLISATNLPTTGTYTLTVRDDTGLGTGAYALTPVSVGAGISQDAGGDGGLLASGVTRTATISTGDIDAHPFYAVVGDRVVITATEKVAGSSLTPLVELYDPAGNRVTYNYNASGTTITAVSLPSTGLYTIVVRDSVGLGTGGYTVLLTQTPSTVKPTVTVAATDALAVEGGFDHGTFTITRTNLRALPLTVTYSLSGTATNGTDYVKLTGTATIPANAASVAIDLSALADTLKENSETVILKLKSGSTYTLGTPTSATVIIDDGATVSGTVFNDLNNNGARTSSEPGLAGWTVYIDLNTNNALDSGERKVVTTSTGTFTITGLAPGTYHLRIVPQTGWVQTLPTGGAFLPFTLTLGGTTSGLLIGEHKS